MALEKCPECGGQLSTTARFCPHCGAQKTPKVALALAVAGAITLLGVGLALFMATAHH